MPSCDGSNCGACACNRDIEYKVSDKDIDEKDETIKELKAQLKKALSENRKLRRVFDKGLSKEIINSK